MSRREVEIGIVGAGPAGARAAELLAGLGAEVVIWDPKAPWEKPCGGGLTASALRRVPELAEVKPRARRIDEVRLETSNSGLVRVPLDKPLYVVPRIELARWQLDRARAAGAELMSDAVRGLQRNADRWCVTTARGEEWCSRLLVGADGAASLVRRVVSPALELELAPTRVAFVPGAGPSPDAIVLRFFPGVAGYLWDFPRPDHRSIGVGVSPGVWTRPQFDEEVNRYWGGVGRCRCVSAVRAGAVIGTAWPGHSRDYREVGGEDFALLGDAAGFADPATGEGIQNALRSAGFLAEAYATDRSFRAYPELARARLEREFRVTRTVRRALYWGDLALRLVDGSARRDAVFGLVSAVVNGGNEHDPHTLLSRWGRGNRRARALGNGRVDVHGPVSCLCEETGSTRATAATGGAAADPEAGGSCACRGAVVSAAPAGGAIRGWSGTARPGPRGSRREPRVARGGGP